MSGVDEPTTNGSAGHVDAGPQDATNRSSSGALLQSAEGDAVIRTPRLFPALLSAMSRTLLRPDPVTLEADDVLGSQQRARGK